MLSQASILLDSNNGLGLGFMTRKKAKVESDYPVTF